MGTLFMDPASHCSLLPAYKHLHSPWCLQNHPNLSLQNPIPLFLAAATWTSLPMGHHHSSAITHDAAAGATNSSTSHACGNSPYCRLSNTMLVTTTLPNFIIVIINILVMLGWLRPLCFEYNSLS
jgi:hypothetical protein